LFVDQAGRTSPHGTKSTGGRSPRIWTTSTWLSMSWWTAGASFMNAVWCPGLCC
jgi:hypothetical protein